MLSLIKEIKELRGDRFFAFVEKELREEVKNSVHGAVREASGPASLPAQFVGFEDAGSLKRRSVRNLSHLLHERRRVLADIDIDDADGLVTSFKSEKIYRKPDTSLQHPPDGTTPAPDPATDSTP